MKQKKYLFLQYLLLMAAILFPLFLIHQNMLTGRTILLPRKWIQALAIDSKDRIWVASYSGIFMIENMTITSYEVNGQSMWATRIGIDENNQVWVVAGTGVIGAYYPAEIYRFDGNNWVFQEKIPSALPPKSELPCCLPSDEMIVTDAQFEKYSAFLEIDHRGDRQLFLQDTQGNLWAGTRQGLVYFSSDFHPPSLLMPLHSFLISGGYWILGVITTALYSIYLISSHSIDIGVEKMAKVKSFFLALGQFILGFVSWILISSWFNMNIALSLENWFDFTFYAVVVVNQLIGLGLAFLAFRFKMRWIGIGILCGFGLFLLGSVIRSPCIPPLVLPFPLTAMGWC
jgi:hypothetical protein